MNEYVLFQLVLQTVKKEANMNKKLKPIPQFNNEDDEREFWDTHDSTDYFDWSKAKKWSPEVYKSLIQRNTYKSSENRLTSNPNFIIRDAPRKKDKKSK